MIYEGRISANGKTADVMAAVEENGFGGVAVNVRYRVLDQPTYLQQLNLRDSTIDGAQFDAVTAGWTRDSFISVNKGRKKLEEKIASLIRTKVR